MRWDAALAINAATVPDGDRDLTVWSWLRATARPIAIVLGLGIGVAGCTAIPGDGPWMGGAAATSTEALPFDVIDLTPTTIASYNHLPAFDVPSSVSNISSGGRISVAPGDVLKVRIFEPYEGSIFPTIQRPGADFGVQRVTDDGTISVPFVGTIHVAGMDLGQIEKKVSQQVAASGRPRTRR
jgi:polysaccharide export outer membrane protein